MTELTAAAATDLFRRPPERFLDVGAPTGAIAHRRVGDGPDVLLVHGWPVSGATFRRLLPLLSRHATCHVIDLPGAGSSDVRPGTTPTVAGHIAAVRRAVDALGLDDVAVVGHDSGGLIARHALAGDERVRAMGLIDSEQPGRPTWRFRSFVASGRLPGAARALRWALGRPSVRRHPLLLGSAFVDRSLIEGEFDELFLQPLRSSGARLAAAAAVLRSFDMGLVHDLAEVHARIRVPVQMVWGEDDPFFPVARAEAMVGTFPDARLAVVAGASVFVHEERPDEVAEALLPVLVGPR